MTASDKGRPKGGSFLTQQISPDEMFAPEDFPEELQAMKAAARDFMQGEIAPRAAELDQHDWPLVRLLVKRAGELDLLGVDIDEEYGGLGLGLTASALIIEAIGGGGSGSFAITVGANNGISTWPLLYFGNEEQKARYLPGIASGDLIAAYALTEPSAGSDALSGKCKAVLSDDGGHWIVNGEKIFITNAALADVYTTLVKIDGDDKKTACLLIDRNTPGLTVGPEEHKMGLRGSSTASLSFVDARVPVGNLLGEVGQGYRIVFNTLNLGRFKLGAGAVGNLKSVLTTAVQYAAERQQFGQPLTAFDAIQAKLADMAVDAWVSESMSYRTAGLLTESLEQADTDAARLSAIKEYTIECAIVKVAASEMLDRAVDQALQIHGGYGFVEEYPVARAYRDSRVNRIFEGTNEINRMLMVGDLIKKAMTGQLPLMAYANNLDVPLTDGEGEIWRLALDGARRATIFTVTEAIKKRLTALTKDQQLLMEMADMMIDVYAIESALLRLEKLPASSPSFHVSHHIVQAYIAGALWRLERAASTVLTALYDGTPQLDQLEPALEKVRRLLRQHVPTIDLAERRRLIAAPIIEAEKYPF